MTAVALYAAPYCFMRRFWMAYRVYGNKLSLIIEKCDYQHPSMSFRNLLSADGIKNIPFFQI